MTLPLPPPLPLSLEAIPDTGTADTAYHLPHGTAQYSIVHGYIDDTECMLTDIQYT